MPGMDGIGVSPSAGAAAASGRFLLRIDPGLHGALREAAKASGLSLNDLCARKLVAPGSDDGGPGPSIVTRAASAFGPDLVGVVAYGSWARDELAAGSDVDVLIVVAERVALRRALYRAWDTEPMAWESRPVEPHFVHPPAVDDPPSGVWIEAAIDGVVLFERGFRLSRRLAAIRRRIVAGELRRRAVHGQPYWTRES
jgi:predicted nucleotidyltransferase